MEQKSKTGLIVGVIIAVVLIVVISFAVIKSKNANGDETTIPVTVPVTNPTDSTPSSTSPQATSSTYKDGTYSAVGNYVSPGGAQTVNVSLTIKNDVVTDATVTSGAADPESNHYQQKFISGYKSQVIGKNLSTLNITKVSGSSLTPKGFNDAVAKIKVQAGA